MKTLPENLYELTEEQRLDLPYCVPCDLFIGYTPNGLLATPGRCYGCGQIAQLPTLRDYREDLRSQVIEEYNARLCRECGEQHEFHWHAEVAD